jgi:hypothetical protein
LSKDKILFEGYMKKTIRFALASMLCISGAFALDENHTSLITEARESDNVRLGSEVISQIRKDYKEGRFDAFLKEIDDSYEKVLETGGISGLAELRQGGSIDLQWLDGVKKLQNERNSEMIQLIQDDHSIFAEKVRTIASIDPQESLFLRFHQMLPGTGKNIDENVLIALDLEYEYKMIHLDTSGKEGLYALKMEQADKMLLASQSFEDRTLKEQVETFAQNVDGYLAKNYDARDLQAMANGTIKPANKVEERVVSVLKDHAEKMSDLAEQFR